MKRLFTIMLMLIASVATASSMSEDLVIEYAYRIGNNFQLYEVRLRDGVRCAVLNTGDGTGGLSCDWNSWAPASRDHTYTTTEK